MGFRAPALAALLSTSACSGGCGLYQGPVSLPAEGTTTPASVPLDIAWETPLVVYSGGSPAPMGVPRATATCSPASRCAAHVVLPFVENDDPKLVVVGLEAGPATVELRYEHPARKETLTSTLRFVFLPAEDLHDEDVGETLHGSAFLWRHVPDAYRGRTASGAPSQGPNAKETQASARCEGQTYRDGGPSHVRCFPMEDEGAGVTRYPSCDHSSRCAILPGGVLVDGFSLCVETTREGKILGLVADTSASQGPPLEELGVWGTPTENGCRRPRPTP